LSPLRTSFKDEELLLIIFEKSEDEVFVLFPLFPHSPLAID